jgi:TRAP-type C4-dicarboxylate transport system permease small subunit
MTDRSLIENLSVVTRRGADLLLAIGAAGLLLMTAIVGWQVFGRYVLNSSPSWSEQAALTLMIWYVSFGAAAGVR